MTIRRRMLTALAAAALVPLAWAPIGAQAEERLDLVTIVVGFPPGGATDTVARLVAEGLAGTYADSAVVENRDGAGGQIAASYVKDQPADGSVFFFTPAFPMIIHPHLYDLAYDSLEDFVPVVTTHFGVLAFSVGPGVPDDVATLEDFIAWAEENPDEASFGGPVGGSQHFAGMMFAEAAGIEMPLIAYPGGAPSVTDALGGHVPAIVTPLAEVLPHAAEGNLRILAVTSRERSELAPDIPTFHELGFEDVVFQDWAGMLAPAGTPPEVVQRANEAVTEIVHSEAVSSRMAELGMEVRTETPESFAGILPESYDLYGGIIEDTGFELPD